ncbi:DNA polymerase delta small subunit [Culex quinquefasciatus]|uniref:DNA polymerase delta small subunit n=1 Tax=Culex quinquefasciatus TaxID=7176 RepID=B0X9P8_CULQU|nr:DNA polymerase delta small subunit [Culex quinquefasciatus]|eukprot:XP_001866370.1 DNA polymerase delta small subunit [Culex quinquefasciatus]
MLFPEDTPKDGEFKRLHVSYQYRLDKFHFKAKDFKRLIILLIGTLLKHHELKPNILREISEEGQLAPQPPRSRYTIEGDILILEDALQHIKEYLFYEAGPKEALKSLESIPGLNRIHPNMSLSGTAAAVADRIPEGIRPVPRKASSVVRVIVGNTIKASSKRKSSLHNRPANHSTDLLNAHVQQQIRVTNDSKSVQQVSRGRSENIVNEFNNQFGNLSANKCATWELYRDFLNTVEL